MGRTKQYSLWAAGIMAVVSTSLGLVGCDSAPNDDGGTDAEYNLAVVLEKNLESGQDIVYVRFRRGVSGIPASVVVIDADTITTSSASGQGNKTYNTPRWQHGEKIQIRVSDPDESFVYRDSVVIPDEFEIDHVLPANHIWRPIDGNAQVSWTTSIGAVNYLTSVRARTVGTLSVGFSEYSESQTGLSEVIPSTAFRDGFGNVVEDVYDIKIIAYSPNFIQRLGGSLPYKVPSAEDVRTPIINDNVDGGISALVVSVRDTLIVQTE